METCSLCGLVSLTALLKVGSYLKKRLHMIVLSDSLIKNGSWMQLLLKYFLRREELEEEHNHICMMNY